MKKNWSLCFIVFSTFLPFFIKSDQPFKIINMLAISNQAGQPINTLKHVKGCSRWGFWVEFFWTLTHLAWCEKNNKIPVVYWDERSAYHEKDGYNGSKNVWEYYFEPVSELFYEPGDKINRSVSPDGFRIIYHYPYYIAHPEEPTLDFRRWVKRVLIDRYIKIKPSITKKINKFYSENMEEKHTIGIHLRGKHLFNEIAEIPVEKICEEANKHASPQSQFFIATDQIKLLEKAKKLLNGKVIFYDCYRSDDGPTFAPKEPIKPEDAKPGLWGKYQNYLGGHNYSKALMGEDVLIEGLLLSQCNFLVRTLSNVSNAALFFNPELKHITILPPKVQ